MKSITGLTREQIDGLVMLVREARDFSGLPPIMGIRKGVIITLTYLRTNRIQADLAETYGFSQPTISRTISALTPVIGNALASLVPTLDDLPTGTAYLLDGTLVPC